MAIIVFVVILLVGLLIGGLLVKSYQRKAKELRDRRLKIAEGKWDEIDKEEAKNGRFGRVFKGLGSALRKLKPRFPDLSTGFGGGGFGGGDNSWGGPPRELEVHDAKTLERMANGRVPHASQTLLQTWRNYSAGVSAVEESEKAYVAAKATADGLARALNSRLESNHLGDWLQEYMNAHIQLRVVGRDYAEKHTALTPLRVTWKSASDTLTGSFDDLQKYAAKHGITADQYSESYKQMMEVGRLLASECSNVVDPPRQNRAPVGWELPPEGIDDGAVKEIIPFTKAQLDNLRGLTASLEVADTAHRAFKHQSGSFALGQPAKPTEQDVQEFVDSLFSAASVLAQQDTAYRDTLPPAREALRESSKGREALLVAFDGIVEAFRAKALEAIKVSEYPSKKTPAKETKEKEDWRKLPFSDKGRAVMEAAHAVAWCAFFTSAQSNHLLQAPLLPVAVDEELNEADANNLNAVRNALRKVGFGLAQSKAAYGKYVAAENLSSSLRQPKAPTLQEANADKYIRAHRRMVEDRVFNDALNADKAKKVNETGEQRDARNAQLEAAAEQVADLLQTPPFKAQRETMPRQLDTAIRAANLLYQKFKSK